MLATQEHSLQTTPRTDGAGVYALYYRGHAGVYQAIGDDPIYVGKAIPEGGRTGGAFGDQPISLSLRKRMREHLKSVQEAENLDPSDFGVRLIVVDDIWIPLGENVLIEMYRPVWNVLVTGFGNHAPGEGRRRQMRSLWDTLHPGRPWTEHLPASAETAERLAERVIQHFAERSSR